MLKTYWCYNSYEAKDAKDHICHCRWFGTVDIDFFGASWFQCQYHWDGWASVTSISPATSSGDIPIDRNS